jgi:hypothetical protein
LGQQILIFDLTMESIPEKYRHDLSIIRDTAKQLARDLNMDESDFKFSGNEHLAFDELKMQLLPIIEIIYNDTHAFQAMLYKIDISERDFKKILEPDNSLSVKERITETIIRREFQKVLTKRFFSEQ